MNRSGSFLFGALIFAGIAVAVLVWTDMIDLGKLRGGGTSVEQAPVVPIQSQPVAEAPPPSREAQLVTAMNEAAAGGGFVVSFMEKDAKKWSVAEGHQLERLSLDPSGPTFARLTSSSALEWKSNDWPKQGLSVMLPLDFAKRANGKKIEIGVVARSAATKGTDRVTVVYATGQAGNSHWQAFALKPQFETLRFTYDVPAIEGGYTSAPIIALTSDPAGKGRALELIGIYVKVLS